MEASFRQGDFRAGAVEGGAAPVPAARASLYGIEGAVEVWARETLTPGMALKGPALITEQVSTTYLAPGWYCQVDPHGNLLLHC